MAKNHGNGPGTVVPIASRARAGRIVQALRVIGVVMGELIYTVGWCLIGFTFLAFCAAVAGAPENEGCDDESN